MAALISLGVFAVIRMRNAPGARGTGVAVLRLHTGGAWLILFMIFNVLWTMFFFRGAASALGAASLRVRRVRLDRRRQPVVRAVPRARWRWWRASGCCCTSA